MKIKETESSRDDISLVEIKKGTPSCKEHGAMNKWERNIWRCFSLYKGNPDGCYPKGVKPIKFIERACNAGCIEI